MKKLQIILAAVFGSFLSASCTLGPYQFALTEDNVDDRVKSLTDFSEAEGYRPNDGTDWTEKTGSTYTFLIVTDMHIGAARYSHDDEAFYKWFENACKNTDETKIPRFIVNLGDIADTGDESQFDEYSNKWCVNVRSIAKNCGIVSSEDDYKIYSIVGNHDLYHDGRKYFKNMIWPHCYSYYFDFASDSSYEGFGYYFFDTGNGSFGKNQYNSMVKVMTADPRPKIVFTHYPVYGNGIFIMTIQDSLERAKILTLLCDTNAKTIQEGHVHRWNHVDYNGFFFEDTTENYSQHNGARLVTVDEAGESVTTEGVNF